MRHLFLPTGLTIPLAAFLISGRIDAQPTYHADTSVSWQQAVRYYTGLASRHRGTRFLDIGRDDGGQPIHLFVIGDGGLVDAAHAHDGGRNVLWITNGIHSGESDGVDASMMLARALLDDDHLMGLLVHTTVCIVPVYNVSGYVQRFPPSRPDQNGPVEHGVRANARDLDLNRDFTKLDAWNTRALERALAEWDPDVYLETHVSNGADHQYVMELLTTQKDKLDPGLAAFMAGTMVPELHAWMDRKKIPMGPYFETRKEVPDSGLIGYMDGPRYSTGYNGTFDRIALLAESHMLKPYADRVNATLQLQLATLAFMDRHAEDLRRVRAAARESTSQTNAFGLQWTLDTTRSEPILFKGYAFGYKPSEVSGLPRLYYDRSRPMDLTVPWYDHYVPGIMAEKPAAYLVPQAWHEVIERLQASGVEMRMLARDTVIEVEEETITAYETARTPFEGHYRHSEVQRSIGTHKRAFAAGDIWVPMGRPTDRFVVNVLDPRGEDSYFSWGSFDSVLQRREWFSPYVFEDRATELLQQDPALKQALDDRRRGDPQFAADAMAQLAFIFDRSPWAEAAYHLHPVFRVPRTANRTEQR